MDELLTDSEVVQQVQNGNSQAFDLLMRRHQARMRATVARYVCNREDVFDIVQDVFLDAFRHIDTFDRQQEFLPWLRTICRNRMLNYFRKTKRHNSAIQLLITEAAQKRLIVSEHYNSLNLERVRALNSCFGKLTHKYQDIIRLRYQAHMTVKDMALQLNRGSASVSSLLYRIRATLARCVQKELAREKAL